MLYALCCNHV